MKGWREARLKVMPDQPGISSCEEKQCATCVWWRTPRRKKTCKRDRVVRVGGRLVTGTPSTYLCDEYSPRSVAKCGECLHWKDLNRPRKRFPCSELSLTDDAGVVRTESSTYCGYFNQGLDWEPIDNLNLRVDGMLVSIIDLHTHSTPQAFLIRQTPGGGLLAVWKPSGPGAGEWDVAPVTLQNEEDGELELRQYIDTDGAQVTSEVLFDAKAKIVYGAGNHEELGSQEMRQRNRLGGFIRKGLSKITLMMKVARQRITNVPTDAAPGEIERVPLAKRLQDEPWATDWLDLKDQVMILRTSGESLSSAVLHVQRGHFRESGARLTPEDAKRLQAQLMAAFQKGGVHG